MKRLMVLLAVLALIASACVTNADAQPPTIVYGPDEPQPEDPNADPVPRDKILLDRCDYVGSATVDPIVFPGDPTSSHLHDFFGVQPTENDVTHADLQQIGPTTCNPSLDLASYWGPSAYDDQGVQILPIKIKGYYFSWLQQGNIVPWSREFRMITDLVTMNDPSSGKARVIFPSCWNGDDDSADHRSHVAFRGAGQTCPASHPINIPRLSFIVHYQGGVAIDRLSSGDLDTAHFDLMNGWDEEALARLVNACNNIGTRYSPENAQACSTGELVEGVTFDLAAPDPCSG